MMAGQALTWESRQQLGNAGADEGELVVGHGRYFKIGNHRKMGHLRVGREEEGTSSLRPELAALEATLEQCMWKMICYFLLTA
jgi:hypothetical protein